MLVESDLDETRSSHDNSFANESVSTCTNMDEADRGVDDEEVEEDVPPDRHCGWKTLH